MKLDRCTICDDVAMEDYDGEPYCEDCYDTETFIEKAADAYISGIDDHSEY
jgi:hypothetical protein|tara:strand:+ start:318 stop:470 length:153 start_codon:yes stop_codon:yes gene_type:complete